MQIGCGSPRLLPSGSTLGWLSLGACGRRVAAAAARLGERERSYRRETGRQEDQPSQRAQNRSAARGPSSSTRHARHRHTHKHTGNPKEEVTASHAQEVSRGPEAKKQEKSKQKTGRKEGRKTRRHEDPPPRRERSTNAPSRPALPCANTLHKTQLPPARAGRRGEGEGQKHEKEHTSTTDNKALSNKLGKALS